MKIAYYGTDETYNYRKFPEMDGGFYGLFANKAGERPQIVELEREPGRLAQDISREYARKIGAKFFWQILESEAFLFNCGVYKKITLCPVDL